MKLLFSEESFAALRKDIVARIEWNFDDVLIDEWILLDEMDTFNVFSLFLCFYRWVPVRHRQLIRSVEILVITELFVL